MSRRYEKLRRAALGEAALVDDRSGLVLFLRHGMVRWIRCIGEAESATKKQATSRSRSAEIITTNQNNAVVKILAGMTLHTQNRKERST